MGLGSKRRFSYYLGLYKISESLKNLSDDWTMSYIQLLAARAHLESREIEVPRSIGEYMDCLASGNRLGAAKMVICRDIERLGGRRQIKLLIGTLFARPSIISSAQRIVADSFGAL